jgi:hypothetical protein
MIIKCKAFKYKYFTMNPEFEQKVNSSIEQQNNQVVAPLPVTSSSSKINRDFNRKLAFIFIGAIVCFALLIIVRGVLLQNPATFDNNSIIGQILNPNGVTGLNGLELTQAQSIINDFTSKVKREYQEQPTAESRILLASTDSTSVIGELNKNGKYNKILEIGNLIEIFRYYDNNNILYAINSPNVSLSELYLNTSNSQPILIKRLDKDQKFIDAHFSIDDKTFYYTFFDANNTVFIEATDVKGTQYQLYKTNFLNTKTRILNVAVSNGYVYLNQDQQCFSLLLRDRELNSFACEKIITNNNRNFYWSNEQQSDFYTTFEKGELYKFSYGELERKVLVSKNNGEVIQKLWLSGNNMYYLVDELVQVNNRLWSAQAKEINFVNVNTAEQGGIDLKSMRSDIYSIIPFDSLMIITEEFAGRNELLKYNPNPQIQQPSSYPESFPVSYSMADTQKMYWESVDLGFNYNKVQVIQPFYTYKF